MNIEKVHLLFEQSGTFKKQFKELGIDAYDYDICDDFDQTDYKIDLFSEIKSCYEGGPSIFDDIKKDDLIIAFFPCVRFEDQIILSMRGENCGMKKWPLKQKMKNSMKIQRELTMMYEMVNMLFIICIDRELRLI